MDVEDLDENLRVPFQMLFEGSKYQEIADTLEIPVGTVKSRIFFARKALQEAVSHIFSLSEENELFSHEPA